MWEDNRCRMGDVQGPGKLNDTCMKTMCAGMMNRGFTVWRQEGEFYPGPSNSDKHSIRKQ